MNRVIFTLPGKPPFTWVEGCNGVNNVEIKELIIECSYALGSLQYELSLRQEHGDPAKADEKLNYCCDKLQVNAQRINKDNLSLDDLKQLTDQPQASGPQSADRSMDVLQLGPTKLQPKSRDGYRIEVYDELLWLIFNVVGPAHALLVKCSFGKARVTVLDLSRRARFIQYVKQNRSLLFCTALEKKAIELGLANDNTYPDSRLVPKKRNYDTATGEHGSHQPSDVSTSSPVILDDTENHNASTRQTGIPERVDSNKAYYSSNIDYLLLLFNPLGDFEFPRALFERVRSPQFRWTEHGLQSAVTALDDSLDYQLIDMLSDETRVIQTIHELDQARWGWGLKLLKWICFVFPRDQLWEPQFAFIGNSLLPLLYLVIRQLLQKGLPAAVRNDVVEVLLAASKIGNLSGRQKAVTLAKEIMGGQSPEHLQVAIAHQQSVISRLVGDFDHSEYVIQEFCRCAGNMDQSRCTIRDFYHHLQPNQFSKRLNTIYGLLHLSHLENLVQCEKYSIALEEVHDWKPSEDISLMECRVLSSRQLLVAKIFRSQGLFTEARVSLETWFKILIPQDINRVRGLCSLADVYSDLNLPEKAFTTITPAIQIERKKGRRGKSFRRLLVSAIDADLGRRSYEDAEETIQEVEAIFNDLSNLDVSDELLHVRVLVASARIFYYKSQFSEAIRKWEVALSYVQEYKSFTSEGFTYAIIRLSVCLIYLETGKIEEGWKAFQNAETILSMGMKDFWMPTISTRWLPDVLSIIQLKAGWECGPGVIPASS